jgi:hypothetical protein
MAVHAQLGAAEAADRLALRELFDAYARCADRRDAEGQKALFTDDSVFAVYMSGDGSEPTYALNGREALTPVFGPSVLGTGRRRAGRPGPRRRTEDARLPVSAGREPAARRARLEPAGLGLPVRLPHELDRLQPDRRDAALATRENSHGPRVGRLGGHGPARRRASRQRARRLTSNRLALQPGRVPHSPSRSGGSTLAERIVLRGSTKSTLRRSRTRLWRWRRCHAGAGRDHGLPCGATEAVGVRRQR